MYDHLGRRIVSWVGGGFLDWEGWWRRFFGLVLREGAASLSCAGFVAGIAISVPPIIGFWALAAVQKVRRCEFEKFLV